MKKFLTLWAIMASMMALSSCSDDDEDVVTPDETDQPTETVVAAPTISLQDADIDETQEITADMSVIIDVTAEGGIAEFSVDIDSPYLTDDILGVMGLSTSMELVSASDAMASALNSLGFPTGSSVEGATSLSIDLSTFIPMIAQLYNIDSNHAFKLTVTDEEGQSTTKTLTCHLTGISADSAAPAIVLRDGDIDEPQEITDEMSVVVDVTAEGTIAGFTVEIDSPILTDDVLAMVGLSASLDLVNAGDMATMLEALGFPTGDAVAGQTELSFDISALVPMIAALYGDTPIDSNHNFVLTVTDALGQATTKTLTCHLTGISADAAAPTIVLRDGDIDSAIEIESTMSVIVDVTAEATVAGFTIGIDSPILTEDVLGMLGLSTSMDLINASGTMAEMLVALGFKTGDDVKGATELSFDISELVPMIAALYGDTPITSDHNFILTVTDALGQTTTKTLNCHLTGLAAPTIELQDADIDQPQEIQSVMTVIVNVTSEAGIAGFTVGIDSPILTADALGELYLSTNMDLINPETELMGTMLQALGFKTGDDVKGATELSFDISELVPMIALLYGSNPVDSNHKFILTVTDALGQVTTKTLTCHLSGTSAE